MKNLDHNSIFSLANLIRPEYDINNVIYSLSSIAIAKALSPNNLHSNTDDINKTIDEAFKELKSEEDIPSELINNINELNLDYRKISTFLFDYLSKSNSFGVFDISSEISKELAKLIKLPYKGDIALLNCSGISLLKEAILQNKFKGNVHLFCQDKLILRIAFLHLYPVNKNIILHTDLDSLRADNSQKFDFIYYLTPVGVRKNENSTEMYISQAKNTLKENGQFLLVSGIDFLSGKDNKLNRELILNNFNVDLILSCLGAFLPYSGIAGAMVIFNKGSTDETNTFVTHINFLEKNKFKDLGTVIKGYRDHKKGNLVQSVSPLMNHVDKKDLLEDFVVARFDPKMLIFKKDLLEKYELKRLSDVCEVFNKTEQYGPNDYIPKQVNSVKYIRVQDLKDGKINIWEAKNVERKSEKEMLTQPWDLLVSVTGTIGKVALVDEESSNSLPSSHLVTLRPYKDLIDSKFLLLALQSQYVVRQIINNISGETISQLSIKSLRLIEIPVLPLVEQKRIAERIYSLQEELARLKSRVEGLEHELQYEINHLF